jgi:hypothetical protein
MCRAQLRRRGGLSGAASRRGLGTACSLSRLVEMRPCRCSLRVGDRVLPLGDRGLLIGGHAHVPPNRARWVGTPDWVESRFGWVLPGCGIAVRPLPRLIHRRCFTVLCWSRDGTAPAPLAGPFRGGCRRRCRPHRFTLLPFPVTCLIGGLPSSPQPECGQELAEEPAAALFIDLRYFIGSPSDGSRLPSPTLTRRPAEPERAGRTHPVPELAYAHASRFPSGTVALPPLRPQNAESQDGTGRRPGTAPARSSIPQQPTTPS